MKTSVGDTLLAGRYRVRSTIGVGGMARVVLADDERLGRPVAIKRLHADSPEDAAVRIDREARLGASLNHPNLVAVYDIESDEESVLIVMEYVPGRTLADALVRGPLPPAEAAAVIDGVAAALDHVHGHGIVHRDVKPGNILLRGDGSAKLADLGIAHAIENTHITQSGTVLGSVRYMAPEQLEGGRVGPAADVYSFAAVVYEMLSGERARRGDSPLEIAHAAATNPVPDLRAAWPEAPEPAVSALARALAVDPAARPPSAGLLADELRASLHGSGRLVRAPARSEYRPGPRWMALAPAVALLCGVAIAATLLIGGGGDGGGDERAQTRQPKPAKGAERRPAASEPAPRPSTPKAPAARAAQPSGTAPGGGPAALNARGYALLQGGDPAAAIPFLRRAVAANSGDLTYAYALFNLARALRLAGRPAEAIPLLERRLRIPNQIPVVQRELAAARRAAG